MQFFSVEYYGIYKDGDFDSYYISFYIKTFKGGYNCAEYINSDKKTICINNNSWIDTYVPWSKLFNDMERPVGITENDYYACEKRYLRQMLQSYLIKHPI